MTDTPQGLTGDDAMAFSFLSRAANAIVSASDLSRQLSGVKASLDHLTEARDTLEEIKRNQEERIASQTERLQQLDERVSDLIDKVEEITTSRDGWKKAHDDRQRDVDLLDTTVASLRESLSNSNARSSLLAEALDATLAKLNAVRSSLGLPPEPNPHEAIDEASRENAETISEPKDESMPPGEFYGASVNGETSSETEGHGYSVPPSLAPDTNPQPRWIDKPEPAKTSNDYPF